MTSTNDNLQSFRVRPSNGSTSSTEIITIPSHPDQKTGKRVVLWTDIQLAFKGAMSIMMDNQLLPPLKDGNFVQLEPPRIEYQSGVVLDVVMEDAGTRSSSQPQPVTLPSSISSAKPTQDLLLASSAADLPNADKNDGFVSTPVVPYPELFRLGDMSNDNAKSLIPQPTTLKLETIEPVQFHINQLINSTHYTQIVEALRTEQLEPINQVLDKHFKTIFDELAENKGRQFKQLELQEMVLRKQQEVLDRLVFIQNRIQAVTNQTFELHEYPVPRLFIVLPKAARRRIAGSSLSPEQFRLYFLCECGTHTNGNTTHEIHLARHEGYDLEQPAEFFKQFGGYALAILQMIKYGTKTSSLVVLPIDQSKLVDGQRSFDFSARDVSALVDEAIAFIPDPQNNLGNDDHTVQNRSGLNAYTSMGVDLRQLQSYLKVKDPGKVLGNLNRVVTEEGHVKWVCIDHFHEHVRESAMIQLKNLVESNRGTYIEGKGSIEIEVGSKALAKELYEAMTKARGVHELAITLQWNATMKDFRKLADAATQANIVDLALDGSHFKGGPVFDFFNRRRRYDPILQLMSNGRIQTLELKNFGDFFMRVSNSPLVEAPRLRVLSIDTLLPLKEKAPKSVIKNILEKSPFLTELTVRSSNIGATLNDFEEMAESLPNLRSITVLGPNATVVVGLSKGEVLTTDAAFPVPCQDNAEHQEFLRMGYLTHLKIAFGDGESTATQLEDVIRRNPKLSTIHINCPPEKFLAIIEVVTSIRDSSLSSQKPSNLRKLVLQETADSTHQSFGNKEGYDLMLDFPDDTTTDIVMHVRALCGRLACLHGIFRSYGWAIQSLDACETFTDNLAAQLDDSTKEKGSKLICLALNPAGLSAAGLTSMEKVMERSKEFRCYRWNIEEKDISKLSRKSLEDLMDALGRHGRRVSQLTVNDPSADLKVLNLADKFPIKQQLPDLYDIRLICSRESTMSQPTIPSVFVKWLTAMISNSVEFSLENAGDQVALSGNVDKPSGKATIQGIRSISLEGVQFGVEDWSVIIKAIDFRSLETLSVPGTNFSLEQLKLLIENIPDDNTMPAPLKNLDVENTKLSDCHDIKELRDLYAKLELRAPAAKLSADWRVV
ncbi:hypothetical protein B0O80DRAFT_444388 [Mortierella sp. GBAus27b]|nr:hypothetical protein BGX31_005536 [Mortierella sp. GBA43]KAI8358268.1 hypothetical protein B0O80DRAFT_444388 [Mortierella sp. GBAus27b]